MDLFDPLELAKSVDKIISSGEKRKYYRFRPAPYYGGISTADCVGCCLRCIFCWSWHIINQPENIGRFYSPEEVAKNLISIARKKGFNQIRISGNEPTINRAHLLKLISLIPIEFQFILETNGILIGNDPSYAKDLSQFPNLYVRVSLKGASSSNFSQLTHAKPVGFDLQIRALENLVQEGVECFPAVMADFSKPDEILRLRYRLEKIRDDFYNFEKEELILYPFVEENLKKAGIHLNNLL